MIEYTVRVYPNGNKFWYSGGELHNEHGPAIENADGYKSWFLSGEPVTEEQHKRLTSKALFQGKVVVIDGIKYELKEV